MSVEAILERERRLAPRAATCAILAPVLILGSLIAAGRLGLPTSGVSTEQIRAFDANQGALLVIVVVRSIGFLLLIPPLLFLYEAIGARRPGLPRAMVGFTFLGPGLLALQGIFGWIGQAQVASDYISQYQTGGDVYTLLDDLTNDSSISTVGQSLILPAILGLCVAMVYFPLQAQRGAGVFRAPGSAGGRAHRLVRHPREGARRRDAALRDPDAAARHVLVLVARSGLHRQDAAGTAAGVGRRQGDSLAARGRGAG